MSGPFDALAAEDKMKLRKASQPDWQAPMLATLTHKTFSDKDWIFEHKFDGERCLTFSKKGKIKLMSRNKKVIDKSYPELIDFFESQRATDFIIDGEIVAFEKGISSFARLQERMHVRSAKDALATGVAIFYYVFDLIYLDGFDTTGLPLFRRKTVLKKLLNYKEPVRFTPHRRQKGEAYLHEACKKGWEGLIAKRGQGSYVHSRSRDWLKFKCVNQQEFVIGGYTKPGGKRIAFGALLIGYYEKGNLKYAGKVGTGYSDETLKELGGKLRSLESKKTPFSGSQPQEKANWVRPNLVAEVGFTEWTKDGKLRHPRYLGLRRDKKARDVVREIPEG